MVSMKKVSLFVFALTIFFLVIPAAQATDYPSLKADYIRTHPGQSLIPFPWEPITSVKVLPFDTSIPATPGNTLSVTACRNEFEPASFIINAQKDISGIGITAPNLYNAQGNSIPADAIDVRLVKVWYQADDESILIKHPGSRYLTPELLLKDDSLVKVDYVNKINYLNVTLNGSQQYIDISNPAGTFPFNAQSRDTLSLQPFSLKMNENKQIWLTIHVPDDTPAGDYYGDITITTPSESSVKMNVRVTVLPFDLEPAPVEYGLYYRGIYDSFLPNRIGSEYKTSIQYTAELQDMKDHGVLYPTLYQGDNKFVDTVLNIRNQNGLPKDKIYIVSDFPEHLNYIGNVSDEAGLATIANKVMNWRNHTETFGYKDTYFYGIDEAGSAILLSERPAWQAVHNNGGKMFVASWTTSELIDDVGDVLDTAVLGTSLNTTQAAMWHRNGHKIFLYNQPQVGVENPEIYRQNYGFALWNAGYDGAMGFAYQHTFGQSIWNDFDGASDTQFRDHVFAYPTTDGVIDTIQWEGWREGVDDTRYLATLMKKEGSDTSARAIISDSLSKGEDMTIIRQKMIAQILFSAPTSDEKLKIEVVNSIWNITRTTFGLITGIPVNVKFM